MTPALTILAAGPELAEPVAAGWQLVLAALAGIAVIVVLITIAKLHPFLALIFGALTVGIVAGVEHRRCSRLVRRRLRDHRGRGGRPDRTGRDVRQAARRFRGRRRDRRHHRRSRVATGIAVGDGAGRVDHRAADVLRDRAGAADAGDLSGRQAVATVADHRRNPRAGRAVGHARTGAAAPRAAHRDRSARRRPGHHAGAGRRGGDPDGDRCGSVVRQAGRTVGGPRRPAQLRRRRVRHQWFGRLEHHHRRAR